LFNKERIVIEKSKSRVETMATQYGPKLQEMNAIPALKEIHEVSKEQTTTQ